MRLFWNHRGCYGLQLIQWKQFTISLWYVPRTTTLQPHYHPNQKVTIFTLFGIRTTFNCCSPNGEVTTIRASFLRKLVTPDKYYHYANKVDGNKKRVGPFIFLNVIEWLDNVPKHPSEGYRLYVS